MFIVLEGPDAVGKASQTIALQQRLEKLGHVVCCYVFPRYDTPLGQVILRHLHDDRRHNDRAEAYMLQSMMTVDRIDVAAEIQNKLDREIGIIIADRWWPSGVVYGQADGLPYEWLLRIHESLPKADLHILLQVSHAEALARRPDLRDRYERDKVKQEAVRRLYAQLWDSQDPKHWVKVDGTGTPVEVGERIWTQVMRVWNFVYAD